MEVISCPICGSNQITSSEQGYKCNNCNSFFKDNEIKTSLEDIKDQLTKIIDEKEKNKIEKDISSLRINLYKEIKSEFNSNENLKNFSFELLKILPNDYLAKFFYSVGNNNIRNISDFLKYDNIKGQNVSIINLIIEFILKSPSLLCKDIPTLVNEIIENTYPRTSKEWNNYYNSFVEQMKKVNNGFFDETISRDVFVAYSSKDKKKVIEIVNFLEKQDISCYVAFRNLEHGSGATENYQKKLNTAIDNSKVFLFMSSTNSRSKNCDALSIEMQYIKNEDKASAPPEYKRYSYDKLPNYYKKPRVEFIIEDYNGENIVGESISNEFFNEIERVYNKEELALRIFNLCQQDIDSIISKQNNSENKKSTDTKFCCYCSKENPIDAKFCINCGKSVFGITLSEAKNTLSLIESKAKETKTQKSTKTNTISKVVSPLNKESEALLFNKDDFVIENNVLKKYKGLATKVKVPEGVVEISSQCFYNSGIESVEIPSSVTKIGERAFAYCNNLIDIKINDSVLVLGEALFKYCKNLKSVKLPNKITEIPSEMFYNCEKLESVKIPNKVTEIGDYAFNNCLELKSINLPNSIKKIGDSSFHFAKLSSLVLPKNLVSIGDVAFRQNKITGEVVIPASVQKIGDSVFANNSIKEIVCEVSSVPAGWSNDWNKVSWSKSLTNPSGVDLSVRYSTKWKGELNKYDDYDIPDPIINNKETKTQRSTKTNTISKVVSPLNKESEALPFNKDDFVIENNVLKKYKGLATKVKVPEGVVEISSHCFYNSGIESVEIPSSVTKIGERAFAYCNNLIDIKINDSVLVLGEALFKYCKNLKSVKLPNKITEIPSEMFNNCKKLESVEIPNEVTEIGDYAFNNCFKLKSINLPNSIKKIGDSSFHFAKLSSLILPKNLVSIGDVAFRQNKITGEVVIPASVQKIGDSVFANNSIKEIVCEVSSVPAGWSNDWNKVNWSKSLTNPWGVDLSVRYSTKWKGELNKYDDYDIPDPIINNNVKNINTNNVKNNNINNVKSNDIKSNEKNIKENYTEIKTSETASKNFIIENDRLIRYTGDSESNVVIPEGVTVIMMEAFKNSKFSNIKLPSTLKVIERKAFYDCVNLKSILIPNGVTRIEYMAFCCCSSLESVTLPNSIRNIEFGTFLYCKRLVNITLPNNLATIKHSAFGHCVSLESITLPDTLKNIENSAFYNCMNLTSITLSNNLTNIEDSAFYSCMSLKSIVIPNSVINLGKEAFKFCINLSTIQLSKESKLKTISEYCFSCCYELKEITIPNSVENIEKYIFYSCDKLNVIKCVSAINRQKWDKLWNYRKIKGFLVFPIKTIYGYIE